MQKRKLGKSNLEVSALGLGCMGMSFSYGPPKAVLVTPEKGLAAFSIIYTRLEWVGEGWNRIPTMQISMQFYADRAPGLSP